MAKRVKHAAKLGQVLTQRASGRPGQGKRYRAATFDRCSAGWMAACLNGSRPTIHGSRASSRSAKPYLPRSVTPTWPPSTGPGDKGPWHTTYDKKPLNGQVTRWQVWIGEDGARRRILG